MLVLLLNTLNFGGMTLYRIIAYFIIAISRCSRDATGQITRLGSDVCVYSYFLPDYYGKVVENSKKTSEATSPDSEVETLKFESLKDQVDILKETLKLLQVQIGAQQVQMGALMEENVLVKKQLLIASNNSSRNRKDAESETKTGVTYVRWGRTVCAKTSSLLYKGYAGGSHYNEEGGGSNYLCLPEEPQWGNYVNGDQNHGARIFGAEYEFNAPAVNSMFSNSNSGGQSLGELDVPCVVCWASSSSAQIMIPARRECPSAWTLEYRGYLVSHHYTQHRTEYVCLDEEPEVLSGSHADHNGALFYVVEGVCGALPCPPYVGGRELACVVCSR